jgi:hypothetical protein
MLRNLAIGSLLFAGAVSVAQADVFRWVDEHGGVHYSDQWVPGSELIKSMSRVRPSSASSEAKPSPAPSYAKSASAPSSGSQEKVEKEVKQDVAKIREQQCKDAKERYDKAIHARRIYKAQDASKTPNPDDREYLSDQEADAYRVQARKEMQDLCGSSAVPSGEDQ